MGLFFQVVTIHEDVLATTVAVEITIKSAFSLFGKATHQLLDRENYRVEDLGRIFPSPVEVLATETAPVITVDYAIRIENWHDPKHKVLPESLRLRRVARQEVDDALHHPGSIALARMNPGTNEHPFFGHSFGTFRIFILARDG